MKSCKIKLFFLGIFIFLFFGCYNNYENLFTDFNDTFGGGIGIVKDVPAIGDPDFKEDKMLPKPLKPISQKYNVYIAGPGNGKTYRWFVKKKAKSGVGFDENFEIEIGNKKNLLYKFIDTDKEEQLFEIGIEYALCLEVTAEDGTVYTDNTKLILYIE